MEAFGEAWGRVLFGADPFERPRLAPTPRDVVWNDGTASLLRFRRPERVTRRDALPVLLVPSMINRWYVLDLRPGASLVSALVAAGFDVFCLDWGVARPEDRYLRWDDVLTRLDRATRMVQRNTGADRLGLVGYCMGATLATIHAALRPTRTAALVNLAGPIDFAKAGTLATFTDARWFDPEAMTAPGNLQSAQMQAGFAALRPTQQLAKAVAMIERAGDPSAREAFAALEHWASDNVPFPAAAYVTYIRDLYQRNALVRGEHYVAGKRVDLSSITAPVLSITADRDTICPPAAADALLDAVSSHTKQRLSVPGGHVGAVVGSRATQKLYPALASWLAESLSTHDPLSHDR
jgi:polyhydroxyalkanoate synthase